MSIKRCSTIGPSDRPGRKVNALTIIMTPNKRMANKKVSVSKVPADGGEYFFCAKLPATARTGTIIAKRPKNIAKDKIKLKYTVFAFNPANALPLFAAVDVNA